MEFRSAMPFCPPIWRPSKKIRARHASSSHLERCKWQKLLLSAKLSGFPNLDVHYACRPWNSCSSLKTGDKTRSLIASIFLRYGSSASLSLPRLLMDTLVKPRYSPLAIRQSPLSGIHWRPGFRHFPWIGGIAIVVIVFCVAGCVVIITLSDDQPVVSWKFQPAVWLAVISSITNVSIAASLSQGVSIAWWRSALHGTNLENLHHIWSFGKGNFRITRKWSKDVIKMALVALVVTIATIISNPLLQRATHVRSGYKTGDVRMLIDMMEDPLYQAYGLVQYGIPSNTLVYTNFVGSVQNWYGKIPISTSVIPGYYCNGTCEGVVTSPGLDPNCSWTTTLLNLTDPDNNGALLFSTNFTRFQNSFDETVLSLEVLYSAEVDDHCVATIKSEQCNISAAMVQRPILIENQVLSFDRDKATQLIGRIYSAFDSIYALEGEDAGPLSVLHWLGEFYFLSSFTLDLDLSSTETAILAHGIVAAGQQYEFTGNTSATSQCSYTWRPPTADILNAMEEVLFRMAYSPGVDFYPMTNQTFSAHQVTPTLVFHSNYRYLAGAVSVMLLALLAVCIPLWGWWELGRPVSLSPVETAKAFGAPLLQKASKSANADDLMHEIGALPVRYGGVMVWDEDSGTAAYRLEIGHPEIVRKPSKGERFWARSGSVTSHASRGKDSVFTTTTSIV
jgi:hypothetical protein